MKVVAFDCFGTVFDLSAVPRSELRDYIAQIRRDEWAPLELPESWESLPAHPDAAAGIERLRRKYLVVTCSNGPLGLLTRLSKRAGVRWDAIVPLELGRAYKPQLEAYLTVCRVFGVDPADVMMVTANEHFGDLEVSASLGMTPKLIRAPGHPADINALADELGC